MRTDIKLEQVQEFFSKNGGDNYGCIILIIILMFIGGCFKGCGY